MKKTILALSFSALAMTVLPACSKPTPNHDTTGATTQSTTANTTADNTLANNTLPNNNASVVDWKGTYKGIFPCADCEGIKTELELNSDHTYELEEEYQGKGKDNKFKVKGSYTVDSNNPSIISLDQAGDNRKFQKQDDNLYALDSDGKRVEGVLAENYMLKKS